MANATTNPPSGTVTSVDISSEGEHKSATVAFDKETASKTALLLNNTQLNGSQISVTAPDGTGAPAPPPGTAGASSDDAPSGSYDELSQEDKPRARIVAEYLAHGYTLTDQAVTAALDLDHKHGVSKRFMSTLQSLDQRYHATDRARGVDASYGITNRAMGVWSGLGSYFEKATNTPTGRKLVKFYEEGKKEVLDVHAEAKRLADLKKQSAAEEKSHADEKAGAAAPGAAAAAPGAAAPAAQPGAGGEKSGDVKYA